jgi:HK97 family phage major capsid protein
MHVIQEYERPEWPIFASVSEEALKEKILKTINYMQYLTDKAETENRDLTQQEATDFDAHWAHFKTLEARLNGMEHLTGADRRGTGRKTTAQGPNDVGYPGNSILPRAQSGTRSVTAPLIVGKTKEGQDILGYRPGQSLPVSGPPLDYDLGAWARAAFSGDFESIRAQSQTEGVGSDGGFLVPPRLAGQVLDLIRAKARVIQAGAVTVQMDSSTLSFARQTADPTTGWRGELVALPASKIQFDLVNFRAYAIGCTVTLSEEVIMDAPNLTQILQDALGKKMALAFDEAFLTGTGVGQPLGVLVADGVQEIPTVGVLAGYGPFSEAAGKLWEANFEPSGLILNPKTAQKLDELVDQNDQPLKPIPSRETYPKYMTTQMPDVANVSSAVLGDWSQYYVAMRTNGVRVDFSKDATVNNIPGFQNLAVHVRCWARLDGMPVRPNAFVKLTGITTS